MNVYLNAVADRNNDLGRPDFHHRDHDRLTIGGRMIYRRTRWSSALCNELATLADIGPRDRER